MNWWLMIHVMSKELHNELEVIVNERDGHIDSMVEQGDASGYADYTIKFPESDAAVLIQLWAAKRGYACTLSATYAQLVLALSHIKESIQPTLEDLAGSNRV
jgi:hypothetical protein